MPTKFAGAALASAGGGSTGGLEESWVSRRSGLSAAEFDAEFRRPRKPVILTDASKSWRARGLYTPEYFRRTFGAKRLTIKGQEYTLAQAMDLLEKSTPAQPGPYPCKLEIDTDFSELQGDSQPRFDYGYPDRLGHPLLPKRFFEGINNLEIFFGGPGGKFPYMHYDVLHLHAWITQIYGDKEFTVYPPGQEHLLYVNPELPWQSTVENHHDPDYQRYPLLKRAQFQRVTVRAGETLFIPCGWWHTARSLNTTISIAFDQLGGDNWADFIDDVVQERQRKGRPGLAFALRCYFTVIGVWLSLSEAFGANRRPRA
jgi:histone arginine demethylase JMJD6